MKDQDVKEYNKKDEERLRRLRRIVRREERVTLVFSYRCIEIKNLKLEISLGFV